MTFRTAIFSVFKPLPALGLVSAIFLSACSQQTSDPKDSRSAQPQNTKQQIQLLLQQLQNSAGSKRQAIQLQLLRLLIDQEQRSLASNILEQMDPETLSDQQFIEYSELHGKLYIQQGLYTEALTLLDRERLIRLSSQFTVPQQLRFSRLRAKVLALTGSHLASAQQRIYIDPLLSVDEQQQNRQSIWRSLMYVEKDELIRYEQTAFGKEYRGWLSLALIVKTTQGDLDEQVRRLDRWQLQWPTHPANLQLPEDLALIRELAANKAKQIAIMLPTTGPLAPFGQAIRDGLLAAHFQHQQKNPSAPSIKLYNSDTDDFLSLYQQAQSEGAEVIIGPLQKKHVRLLFDTEIKLPTLALNRIEGYGIAPELLIQFGLAPEDEAQQIAELAYLDNYRRALIISPETPWGAKVSSSFDQHWQALGGETVGYSQFTGQQDYSKSIKDALYLQHSENRARRIRQLIGEQIEFEPRRRQDIEMIFMLAKSDQARSLKPLLNYHYASDLPVYATSRIYNGYEDRKKDTDINGVKFTEIPWVLSKDVLLKQQINQTIDNSKQYQRMYALGVDSYQLYPRLKQLLHIPNSRVYGQTGTLRLNASNQIERTLSLAQFKGGRARVIASADQSLHKPLAMPAKQSN